MPLNKGSSDGNNVFSIVNTAYTTANGIATSVQRQIDGITSASNNYIPLSASGLFALNNVSINQSNAFTYRLQLSDAGKLIETNTSASNIILIPVNASAAFPIGAQIDILQVGTGPTTASFDSGVTLNSGSNFRTLNSQWSSATLIKRGPNEWVLVGALR
jgi:hypothetical protein